MQLSSDRLRSVVALGIFFGWSLKNLNYTKSNKAITWIFATIASQVTKESKIIAIAKQKRV